MVLLKPHLLSFQFQCNSMKDRWLRSGWVLVGLAVLLSGCVSFVQPEGPKEWVAWKEARRESIVGDQGWTTVVALQWLQEGTNRVELPEPTAPRWVGWMVRHGPKVEFTAIDGIAVKRENQTTVDGPVQTDGDGVRKPDVLSWGTFRFFVIERGNRLGIRIRNTEAQARRVFSGIQCVPYDPAWKIEARFEPSATPTYLEIQDVTGGTRRERVPGRLCFQHEGQAVCLEALWDEETQDYFVLFRDRSSGGSTYGSGRFLHVAREDANGRTIMDFNYAYNPPCAFTPFATCPLPPRHNWLPFAVPAGELMNQKGHP